jgi:hypothetical protein
MRFITDHPESLLLHFSFKIAGKVKISFAGLIRGQSNAQQTFIWTQLTELKSIAALGKDLGKAKILKVD